MKTRHANALIFTLGLVFVSSIVAVGIVEHASKALKTRASSVCERSLRADAYSALYASLAALSEYSEIDGGIYSPEQGWEKPLADGRVEFENGTIAEVKISDESGKLPLSNLTSAEIAKILEEAGASQGDAKEAADCILDWSDSDTAARADGAEADDYPNGSPKPPNRPIRSFEEFRHIKTANEIFFGENGEPTEIFKTFAKGVSLEHFDRVNLNSAPPETLKMMLDIEEKDYDPELYSALRGQTGMVSEGIVWVKNLAQLQQRTSVEIPARRRAFAAQLLKIEITARRGIGEYSLCAYYGNDRAASALKTKTTAVYNAPETKTASAASGKISSEIATSTISTGKAYIKLASSSSAASKSKTPANPLKGGYKILKIHERGETQ